MQNLPTQETQQFVNTMIPAYDICKFFDYKNSELFVDIHAAYPANKPFLINIMCQNRES
jgi:hypothetical protein